MNCTSPEARLAAVGYALPPSPRPRGNYAPFFRHVISSGDTLLYVSGQTCRVDGVAIAGICAPDESLEAALTAARVAVLNALSIVADACGGTLPEKLTICRLRGFVRSALDFRAHTAILDAASEVLAVAWPESAKPARTAVGVCSLPDSAFIEIELDAFLPPDTAA